MFFFLFSEISVVTVNVTNKMRLCKIITLRLDSEYQFMLVLLICCIADVMRVVAIYVGALLLSLFSTCNKR